MDENALKSCLEKDRRIIAAYLFGSFAKSRASSGSDIDVAIFLEPNVPRTKYSDIALEITCRLIKCVKHNLIDILVLNSAGPISRHQVFAKGRLIFSRDMKRTLRFKDISIAEYLDFLPFRQRAEKLVKKRILGGV